MSHLRSLGLILKTGELILFLLTIITHETTGNSALEYRRCILKQPDWIRYTYLLIEWTAPNVTNSSDIQVKAKWHMEENYGNCSEITTTYCKMIAHDNNSVDFSSDFYLNVTMVTDENRTLSATWYIKNRSCRQPPKVSQLTAVPLNSSCFNVSWVYVGGCYPEMKSYRLSYKESNRVTDAWKVQKTQPTKSCSGTEVVCGLIPYTHYDIGVECGFTDGNGTEYGHWSDINLIKTQTDEDVPAASPEVTTGGFSYTRRDCRVSNSRNIDLYWKNIPNEFKNGKILGYTVDVYTMDITPGSLFKSYTVKGEESITWSVEILCSSSYNVSIRAFTSKGHSKTSSFILIPTDSSVLDVDMDVVPVSLKLNGTLDIRWVLKNNLTYNITSYTVFWCWKTLSGKCESHIGWTDVLPRDLQYSFKPGALTQPFHKYMFGISVQSHNSSSGTMWSKCLYEEDKDVEPPKNLRFMPNRENGTLQVQWDRVSCDGSYVLNYIVHLCLYSQKVQYNCSDILIEVVDGRENSVLFTKLDPVRRYGVYVRAVTQSNVTSTRSAIIRGNPFTDSSGLKNWQIVLIIVGLLAFAGLLVIVVKSRSYFHRRLRQPYITDIMENQMSTQANGRLLEEENRF